MACITCGSKDAKRLKHLLLPSGWIELTNYTEYCTSCAEKETTKLSKIFKEAKENANNG